MSKAYFTLHQDDHALVVGPRDSNPDGDYTLTIWAQCPADTHYASFLVDMLNSRYELSLKQLREQREQKN